MCGIYLKTLYFKYKCIVASIVRSPFSSLVSIPMLLPAQRRHFYLQAATHTGIHVPLLAALYDVHRQPLLLDDETGLGITPANQVSLEAVNTFTGQVQAAAIAVRTLMQSLIEQGWSNTELWHSEQGRYSDGFLRRVANGWNAAMPSVARLELCAFNELHRAYLQHTDAQWQTQQRPPSQSFLDDALRSHLRSLSSQYLGLASQQAALIEVVRLWQGLRDQEAAIVYLGKQFSFSLDTALLFFLRQTLSDYSAYPYQREAFLRFVQLWHQLSSREATILHLQHNTFSPDAILHTAIITFVQRIPHLFQGNGQHRNALVEGFRRWHHLDSRPDTLVALGVDPDLFTTTHPDPIEIRNATSQTDRALMAFLQSLPAKYSGLKHEQEALLHLCQLWYNTSTTAQTLQALLDDLKRTEMARRDSLDDIPQPTPLPKPTAPPQWTPETIQLHTSIVPNGSFTWAQATQGGLYLPPNQAVAQAIIRMAELAQNLRDRIGRPLTILRWYYPVEAEDTLHPFPNSHHALGDGLVFYCDGLTGSQIYWFLDAWWVGGLGQHRDFPYLCYVDGRCDRVRWFH